MNFDEIPNQTDFQLVKWLSNINETMITLIDNAQNLNFHAQSFDDFNISYCKIVTLSISHEVKYGLINYSHFQ